jgi:hypothetical protein
MPAQACTVHEAVVDDEDADRAAVLRGAPGRLPQ